MNHRTRNRGGRPHQKPIGETGPLRVANVEGTIVMSWGRVEHPTEKQPQEFQFAQAFIQAVNHKCQTTLKVVQLGEDDFDFAVLGGTTRRYLELMEIVISTRKQSPYTDRGQLLQAKEFYEAIRAGIYKNSAKYRGITEPLDLLLYYTHWRFRPIDTVIKLIAHLLHYNPHPFSSVYFHPLSDDMTTTDFAVAFPNPDLLRGFDPIAAKRERWLRPDPSQMILISEDGNTAVESRFSSENMREVMK